jgi:hypothetical protein
MGRFYQTTKPNFLDNIIYQPPWELAKEVLQKEQGDYDLATSTANLYTGIDYNTIDDPVIKEQVRAKQEYYTQRADAITNALSSANADDWRKQLPILSQMKRELEADYKTGDISKMQSDAAQYAAMNKHLEGIKDSATREAAKQKYINAWRADPNRKNNFTFDQTYDKKDLTAEFLAEKKTWDDPNITEAITQWKKNGYINTQTTSKKSLDKLKEAFGQFVQAKGYEPYLQQQQSFGLGNYFDPETNQLMGVDDKRSSLSAMGDYIKQGEYEQITKNRSDKVDILAQEAREEARAKQVANMVTGGANKSAATNFLQTSNAKDAYIEFTKSLAKEVGYTGPQAKGVSLEKIYEAAKKTGNKKLMYRITSATEDFKNSMKASWQPLVQHGYNQKQVDELQKKTNEYFNTKGQSVNYTYQTKNSKGELVTINNVTPKSMIGKFMYAPNGQKVKIKNVAVVKDSSSPVLMNPEDLNKNDIQTSLKFEYDTPTEVDQTFYLDGYSNMQKNISLTDQ